MTKELSFRVFFIRRMAANEPIASNKKLEKLDPLDKIVSNSKQHSNSLIIVLFNVPSV
jgi:hypothetical protein